MPPQHPLPAAKREILADLTADHEAFGDRDPGPIDGLNREQLAVEVRRDDHLRVVERATVMASADLEHHASVRRLGRLMDARADDPRILLGRVARLGQEALAVASTDGAQSIEISRVSQLAGAGQESSSISVAGRWDERRLACDQQCDKDGDKRCIAADCRAAR